MMRCRLFVLAVYLAAGYPASVAAGPVQQAHFSLLDESKIRTAASGPDLASDPGPAPGIGVQAAPGTSTPVPVYSPLHGIYGSLIGMVVGGLAGGLAAAPAVEECTDGESGRDEDSGSLCGLYAVFGAGVGAGIGYSLGVPVGGHFGRGMLTRKFAINMAAISVLTGVLAYADWRMLEAYGSASFNVTIPLSVVAPHLAAYLIGR